jgi:hypothetical protein
MQNAFEAKHEDWHEEGEIVENRSNRSSVWNAEETSKVAHVVIIFFFICRHGVTSVRPPHCPQNFSPSVCLCLSAGTILLHSNFYFIFAANSYSTMVNLLKQFSSRKFSTQLQRRNTSKQTLEYSRKNIIVVASTTASASPFFPTLWEEN